MLSLSGSMRPQMLHTVVDAFVEGKKAQVKQQLRQAMETVLDDLFSELLDQLKDMLLPAVEENRCENGKGVGTDTASPPTEHQTTETVPCLTPKPKPKPTGPKSPQVRRPVFAVKSKPGTGKHSAGGVKRTREPDIVSVDMEHSDDDHQASSDQEVIIATKKVKTAPEESEGTLEIDPQSNTTDALPPPADDNTLAKFVCTSSGCGKRFTKKCNLQDHERLHSGVNPFRCTFPGCSHTGKKRTNVMQHIRSVHLKNLKPGQEDDPKAYLEVKQDLLK